MFGSHDCHERRSLIIIVLWLLVISTLQMFSALDLIDYANALHVHYYGIINKLSARTQLMTARYVLRLLPLVVNM